MKTKLFQKGPADQLLADVKKLAVAPLGAFTDFVQAMGAELAKNEEADPAVLLPIASRHDVPLEDLMRATSVAQYLLRKEQEDGDTVEAVGDDLISSKTLSPQEAADIVKKVREAAKPLSGSLGIIRKVRDVQMTFPTLEHFHTRCSVAVRFDRTFNATTDDLSTYAPKVEGLTPVVVVQLDINKYDETERVAFALRLSELSELTNHFQFAEKQLHAFQRLMESKST